MKFSIDIPDAQAPRVINALCEAGGYQDTIPDEAGGTKPNPQTKQQFAKGRVISFIRSQVVAVEADSAADDARAEASAAVTSEVTIT